MSIQAARFSRNRLLALLNHGYPVGKFAACTALLTHAILAACPLAYDRRRRLCSLLSPSTFLTTLVRTRHQHITLLYHLRLIADLLEYSRRALESPFYDGLSLAWKRRFTGLPHVYDR